VFFIGTRHCEEEIRKTFMATMFGEEVQPALHDSLWTGSEDSALEERNSAPGKRNLTAIEEEPNAKRSCSIDDAFSTDSRQSGATARSPNKKWRGSSEGGGRSEENVGEERSGGAGRIGVGGSWSGARGRKDVARIGVGGGSEGKGRSETGGRKDVARIGVGGGVKGKGRSGGVGGRKSEGSYRRGMDDGGKIVGGGGKGKGRSETGGRKDESGVKGKGRSGGGMTEGEAVQSTTSSVNDDESYNIAQATGIQSVDYSHGYCHDTSVMPNEDYGKEVYETSMDMEILQDPAILRGFMDDSDSSSDLDLPRVNVTGRYLKSKGKEKREPKGTIGTSKTSSGGSDETTSFRTQDVWRDIDAGLVASPGGSTSGSGMWRMDQGKLEIVERCPICQTSFPPG
jgi:hypothetical protein